MPAFDLSAIFIVALLGSLGHCIGMCGGFILAYTSAKIDQTWSKAHQSSAHLLYNIGRVLAYVMLGAVFGLIGSAFVITLTTWGVMLLVVGVLMVLMGVSLMGKLKFLTHIEANIARTAWYAQAYRALISSKTLRSFLFLGFLNGLIPCGLVYIFATFALASGSIVDGMLVMAVFGIATVPVLFSFGFVASLIQKSTFRQKALFIASILVIGYGIFTLAKGTMMLVRPDMIQGKISNMHQAQERQIIEHSK